MNEYIRLLDIVKNKIEIREDSFGSVIAAKVHNREEFDLMMSFWTAAYSSCYRREKINGTYVGEDWYFVESETIDYGMDGKSTTYFTQTLAEKKQKFLDFCRKFDDDDQPTVVDAVPVVRCRDCKYNKEHHPFNGKERITVFWCEMENRNARHNDNPDWFCADWKRKDG